MPVYILDDTPRFPSPRLATGEGLLAIGGDLSTERLLAAYSSGIFPWYSEGQPIMWFSPSPRMVVFPRAYKAPKSLRRVVNKGLFEVRIDSDFEEVIRQCTITRREDQDDTWITPEMEEAYIKLHRQGYAHAVSSYHSGKLVGGLYGVSLGRIFFGESMFHHVTDASKVAYHHLVQFALKHNFAMIDAQQDTPHLRRLGGTLVNRDDFLSLLAKALHSSTLKGNWDMKQENQ
jgi:leucyl/phenylalanyl-tRNA--protein transferase